MYILHCEKLKIGIVALMLGLMSFSVLAGDEEDKQRDGEIF